MDILRIVIASIVSLTELFLLTKIIGNRQISEMNMFDYVNGITIGSIAAEMATGIDKSIVLPADAMAIYGLAAALLSWICAKSIRVRRFVNGKSLILYRNGKILKENMKSAKIDINEFIVQCRVQGYFDLSQIEAVIMESSGKISILPKSQYRPINPQDVNLNTPPEHPQVSVIIDGKILKKNLKYTGNDIKWVEKQLTSQKIGSVSDVFYACCDMVKNTLNVCKFTEEKDNNDIFI